MKSKPSYWYRLPALVTAVYFVALLVGTHWPKANFTFGFEYADKALHFAAYAGLAALCRLTWLTLPLLAAQGRKAGFFLLMLCALGAVDELTQIPVSGRHASFYDWVADLTGIVVGLAVFYFVWPGLRRWLSRLKIQDKIGVATAK
jgi:VanZ family protein